MALLESCRPEWEGLPALSNSGIPNSQKARPISTASDGTTLDAPLTIGVPTREEDGVGEISAMAMTLRGSFQLHSLLLPCKFPASSGLPQCSCGFYAAEEIH